MLDSIDQDLGHLHGTHEAIRDGLGAGPGGLRRNDAPSRTTSPRRTPGCPAPTDA